MIGLGDWSVFRKEGIGLNRKSEKTALEKIAREEYTLDWSQSKVFLVVFITLLIYLNAFAKILYEISSTFIFVTLVDIL